MKKKLIAIVALVLIVALTCSLAACNKTDSMFDGKFKKEASKEEASATWKTAQTAMGQDSSELAAATQSDATKEPVKGWKGMTVSMLVDNVYSEVVNGEKSENIAIIQADGSLLFDGSSVAMTVKMGETETKTDKSESKTLSIGSYVKDNTMYANLSNGEKELNLKIGDELGLVGGVIKLIVGGIADNYSETIIDALAEAVGDMSYDDMVEKYEGFKAFVDDSGNYNRIKYALTAQMVADFNGEDEEFVKNATLGECSIIIVTDKETGSFEGMKFEINSTLTTEKEGKEITAKTKSSISMEKCDEVTSFPADLDSYTNVKDIKQEDWEAFGGF